MEEYRDTPDVVFVCVKYYSLGETIDFLRRRAGKDTLVIPILNVFGTGEVLQTACPSCTVLDGCVYIFSMIQEPGIIRQPTSIFRVFFGFRQGQDRRLEAVAKKVEAILRSHGYNVVMTRTDDSTVGLYDRADIANAVKADIFVSIHSNAAENRPEFQGIYTYYHPSSARGARLAQAIQTPLCQLTGGIDRGIKDADFVVLRETEMCAVLVEMGFMTNSEELGKLITGGYQDKLAAAIAEGIVSYLNRI